MHGEMRLRLINEVLIKGYFFRFFLHWSDEVRAFFHRILIFKAFRTRYVVTALYYIIVIEFILCSRRFLPCQTDVLLMSTNAFDRLPEEEKLIQITLRARAFAQGNKKDRKGGGILNEIGIETV